MGVPGFYRWAIKRVPGLRQKCTAEDRPVEFDNLYLDFNGVVHGAINEWTIQEQEEALYRLIEAQVDLLLTIVRPRVLLYIALDGVAPRAKMNQQRSRRFRAARDLQAKAQTIDGVLDTFDRNAVTPGTDFMVRLSARLNAWCKSAVQRPELRGVAVAFSSDMDPGEGEHKIMEVIRHHPDQSHCLCSSDADLIFLGLVSPAKYVTVLRAKNEKDRKPAPSAVPAAAEAAGGEEAAPTSDAAAAAVDPGISASDFEFLDITALRGWLALEFPGCDLSRLCTDFVAMCCLAGNDFLPHVEALDIYNGGIDRLMKAYGDLEPARLGHLVTSDLSLALNRWGALLDSFAAAEVELLLEAEGLGLGSSKKYQGPRPPDDRWDGVSVVIQHCNPRASAQEVRQAMSKQGCVVAGIYQLQVPGSAARPPTRWLVRFTEPAAAVKTLVSVRHLRNQVLRFAWAEPGAQNFMEPPEEEFSSADWRPALAEAVRESFEFWLGSQNLPKDNFLRRHVRSRSDRFVPLKVVMNFNRMKTWCQDVGQVADMLRSSSVLEVQGEGETAMVRAVEDYSVRPNESPEQVARQKEALALMASGKTLDAAQLLRGNFYARHAGPVAVGSPPGDDVEATAASRSRAFFVGMEWVLRYYLQGCSSWSWFYPAHYPPLCASLAAFAAAGEALPAPPLHEPFPPALQLLAVLPPQSAPLLPESLRTLVEDPSSSVIDFYPKDFEVDIKEGDKEWQGVALLPFVDEARLRGACGAEAAAAPRRVAPRAFLAAAPNSSQEGAAITAATTWDFGPQQQLDNSRAKGPSSLQLRIEADAAAKAASAGSADQGAASGKGKSRRKPQKGGASEDAPAPANGGGAAPPRQTLEEGSAAAAAAPAAAAGKPPEPPEDGSRDCNTCEIL